MPVTEKAKQQGKALADMLREQRSREPIHRRCRACGVPIIQLMKFDTSDPQYLDAALTKLGWFISAEGSAHEIVGHLDHRLTCQGPPKSGKEQA